ncbi:uncharacterized protein HKW66_Vig0152220 [Vigna angularis]|uniref:Methyltransferase FkbM domain-containing protein n=1 Tax=Phaseolus angularis TaxID=3914 RepID=A0A8T0JUJ8_PHAAN|nr:uncharacterized protein HKW66_Vig0152220 [Vigna angularis]
MPSDDLGFGHQKIAPGTAQSHASKTNQALAPCLNPPWIVSPFDCSASPQAHPVFANTVEGLRYPFLFSLSNFETLLDKPHKNIVRMLKGKPFHKPAISVTIQDLLDKAKRKGKDGLVVDVGANVGMATFAASAMRFQVLAFEPVLENLQKICEGIYFNRVADLVTVFEAAESDHVGNIIVYKMESRSSIESDGSTEVGTWKDEYDFFELAGMEEFAQKHGQKERETSNVQEKRKQVKETEGNYQVEEYEKKI